MWGAFAYISGRWKIHAMLKNKNDIFSKSPNTRALKLCLNLEKVAKKTNTDGKIRYYVINF